MRCHLLTKRSRYHRRDLLGRTTKPRPFPPLLGTADSDALYYVRTFVVPSNFEPICIAAGKLQHQNVTLERPGKWIRLPELELTALWVGGSDSSAIFSEEIECGNTHIHPVASIPV